MIITAGKMGRRAAAALHPSRESGRGLLRAPTKIPQVRLPGGAPHKNPTDETALYGTLGIPVKGTMHAQ